MRPINRSISPATLMANQIANMDTNRELTNYWETWASNAVPGQGEHRDTALLRIMACHFNNGGNLDLSHLSLTALPNRLPANIISLNADHNQLQHVDCNFSDTLTTLSLSFNNLVDLPNNLPSSVMLLHADNNQLTQLPDNLPSALHFLHLDHNRLVNLPANLPDSLVTLYVNHNQLEQLPTTLPRSLSTLSVNYNQLSAIPTNLPSSLFYFNARHNPLPLRHPNLFLGFLVDFINSEGPLVNFNVLSDVEEEIVEERTYMQKLALWDANIDVDKWESIRTEKNANVFASFVEKLHQGLNIRNTKLKEKIVQWLTYLTQDENAAIRSQTFEIADIASGDCVDRASFYLNKMQLLMIENELLKNNENQPISDVMDAALSLFRLDELRKIAAAHVQQRLYENPRFNEDIEIHLGYECKLRDDLALPIYTELNFSGVARISNDQLLNAKTKVLEQEKNYFLRHLVTESTLWNAKIEAWNKQKKLQLIDEWNDEIVSDQFNKSIDENLKKANIPINDSDARRNAGQKLANDLLYKKLYRLTEAFLNENNAICLIDQFNPPKDYNEKVVEETRL